MATGLRNASSIIGNMASNPIRQLELQQAQQAHGKDNRAVSQEDKMIGKQVADEQKKLMAADKFGDELAMRKDKLAFARKIQAEQMALSEERMDLEEDRYDHDTLFKGMEFSLNLAGVGVGYYRNKQFKKQAAEIKEENRVHRARIERMIGSRKHLLGLGRLK